MEKTHQIPGKINELRHGIKTTILCLLTHKFRLFSQTEEKTQFPKKTEKEFTKINDSNVNFPPLPLSNSEECAYVTLLIIFRVGDLEIILRLIYYYVTNERKFSNHFSVMKLPIQTHS